MNTENSLLPMTAEEMENYKLHRRFDRMGRLVGDKAMQTLMRSHVMIVGLGGVGSWTAESLARSGVGQITLVDFDDICVTNFNRQIHALNRLVGKSKVEVMAERLTLINPAIKAHPVHRFFNADSRDEIFSARPNYVVDAIDNLTAKCQLLQHCRNHEIPVVTSTGSGGRLDPTAIKVIDLAYTEVDPLARELRKILRQRFDFPKEEGVPWGIPAVFSTEPATKPHELHYDGGKGFRCVCPQKDNEYFQCENRNLIMGNASFVTGAFGLVCASTVVSGLLKNH